MGHCARLLRLGLVARHHQDGREAGNAVLLLEATDLVRLLRRIDLQGNEAIDHRLLYGGIREGRLVQLLAGSAPLREEVHQERLARRLRHLQRRALVVQPGDLRDVRLSEPAETQADGGEEHHQRSCLEGLLARIAVEGEMQRSREDGGERQPRRREHDRARTDRKSGGLGEQRKEQADGSRDESDTENGLHRLHPRTGAGKLERSRAEDEEEQAHPERVAEEHPESEGGGATGRNEGENSRQDGAGARRRDDPRHETHPEGVGEAGSANHRQPRLERRRKRHLEGAEHAGREDEQEHREKSDHPGGCQGRAESPSRKRGENAQ